MVILMIFKNSKFINVLVMENVSDIHFSQCECPGGYVGDPCNFSRFFQRCLQTLDFFLKNRTAKSLKKRYQMWLFRIPKSVVKEAKTNSFLE